MIEKREGNTYGSFEKDSIELTLTPGKYRFTLKDSFGDGYGKDGSFKISLNGNELASGGYYESERIVDVLVGHNPELTMSDRDKEWVEAHNSRRKTWHERYDKTYVPLAWSTTLATDAVSWAEELLNNCALTGSGVPEGENLARGAALPDDILKRWVDRQTGPYPTNNGRTQALWRASHYLGCGEAVKNFDDGSICRIQVCRYIKTGNCAMASFNATQDENWLVPVLEEHSSCGPDCPPEGCYIQKRN